MKEISTQELNQKLENNENITVIDVREFYELQETGKIPGAVHIAKDTVSQEVLNEYGISGDTTIIVNCKSGGRSSEVTKYLESLGYENVYNLLGGITQWREDRFDIESVK